MRHTVAAVELGTSPEEQNSGVKSLFDRTEPAIGRTSRQTEAISLG